MPRVEQMIRLSAVALVLASCAPEANAPTNTPVGSEVPAATSENAHTFVQEFRGLDLTKTHQILLFDAPGHVSCVLYVNYLQVSVNLATDQNTIYPYDGSPFLVQGIDPTTIHTVGISFSGAILTVTMGEGQSTKPVVVLPEFPLKGIFNATEAPVPTPVVPNA
ncbi:MAG TPA: hypothetical protein VLH19_04675 [Patescibacteria group bacterium]|nr:hypothetical protein [Patescibacteria group bacterium]